MNQSFFPRFCLLCLGPSLRALVSVTFVLTSLTASADGPAPPASGLPSANQLQAAHNLGKDFAYSTFKAETVTSDTGTRTAFPNQDIMRDRFDDYLKKDGARFSDAEREVFTEAYWKGVGDAKGGGMRMVDPSLPPLPPPDASPTTTVTGKTPTAEPGTLQLTDKDGNSYFVDVDANGTYKTTIPQKSFQPVKATMWTNTGKLERIVKSDGTWAPVSSAAGTSQSSMAPGANITGTAAYALADVCRHYAMLASLDRDRDIGGRLIGQPFLHRVRFGVGDYAAPMHRDQPLARLVDTPTQEEIRESQQQGIEHADREFEQAKLKQSLKDRGVNPDKPDRFKEQKTKLDDKQQDAQQGKGPQLTPEEQKLLNDMNRFVDVTNMINAHNSATKLLGPNPDVEKAAQARRLQRQAQQMRQDGFWPQADALEKTAQSLYGGPLPPLHAGTAGGATGTSGQVEGQAVDSTSKKPLGWAMATGATIYPREHPDSLKDPKLDQQLRGEPVDGCLPLDTTDGEGKFKLKIEYRFGDKFNLDQYHYKPIAPTDTDTMKSQPEPTKPKTPTDQSSTQGAFYRTGIGTRENCAYAYTDTFTPRVGLAYSKEPWTLNVGMITVNSEPGYNFQMTKYTELSALQGALSSGAIASTDLTVDFHQTDGIDGIGHLQTGWQNAQAFQWKIPDNVIQLEEDTCSQIALAPSWNPAHWPPHSSAALPALHIKMSDLYE